MLNFKMTILTHDADSGFSSSRSGLRPASDELHPSSDIIVLRS